MEKIQSNDYVLCITDLEHDEPRVHGNSYVRKPYSVIFEQGLDNYDVFVHEIGHCIGFDHTFEQSDNNLGGKRDKVFDKKNTTENFMDYSDSRLMFWKTDWKEIFENIYRY